MILCEHEQAACIWEAQYSEKMCHSEVSVELVKIKWSQHIIHVCRIIEISNGRHVFDWVVENVNILWTVYHIYGINAY